MNGNLAIMITAVALALTCGLATGCAPSARTGDTAPQPASQTASTGENAPAAAASGAAPSAAAAQQPTAPAAPRKLRLALGFLGAEAMPVFVGLDQGLYRKYGLDVETMVLQSSAQIAPSMASGEIDIGLSAGSGTVDISLAGGEQVLVLNHSNILHFQLVGKP